MGTPLGQEDTGNHLQLLQLPHGTAHFASAVFHWQKTHRVPTPGFKGIKLNIQQTKIMASGPITHGK